MNIKYKDTVLPVTIFSETEHIQKCWQAGYFYEHGMLDFIRDCFTDGLTYIDLGSCIGNHSLFFSVIMKAKQVYSFEPVKKLFDFQKKIYSLNNCQNITAFNYAIWDKNSKVEIKESDFEHNAGMSKIDLVGDFVVTCKKLDTALPKLTELHLIKIDVEGGNNEVLSGMTNILAKFKPAIFIESVEDTDYITGFLKEFNYEKQPQIFNRTPTHLYL